MTIHDSDSPVQTRPKRLQFDRYVVDLDRGCLLLDGSEIALRPKTFAVLHYLTENCGRLVSKEELFAAVWPNLVVTDDALVQSVGELRRALGSDGSRLIKTIPRRGYRFEAAVAATASIPRVSTGVTPSSTASPGEAQASQPAVSGAAPVPFIRTAGTSLRIGLFAALALVVVSAAGILWSGVESDWTFRDVLAGIGLSTTKRPESGAKAAIAILPFRNESNDSMREYFAQGLTQDIINALGRFPELTVMSWNAVYPYKERSAIPGEIARALAVQYQVEGSVLQTGDHIRVIAQLVNADGRVLWSSRFDSAPSDLFALQGKITADIAGALAIRVTEMEEQRVLAKPAGNLEAYDYVLRTRPALQRPTRANNVEARAQLRHAIEIDPNSAAAYAALAETYLVSVVMGWAESPTESLNRAEEMANKALSLDSSQVRAHVTLGRIHIFYHRYEQADAELKRAIMINPNDAHALAGRGNVLMWAGQTDAAVEALEQAQRIDPELNVIDHNALSLAYYLERRYDRAIEEAERNLRETTAANFSRVVLAAAYAQRGRMEDAVRVVTEIRRADPTFDPQAFGSKFLNPANLEQLRDGFRKAGLLPGTAPAPSGK